MGIFPASVNSKLGQAYSNRQIPGGIQWMQVGASQTVQAEDLLILTSNLLVQSVALPGGNSTFGASAGSQGQMFIANGAITTTGSPTTADVLAVRELTDDQWYLCRFYSATAANSKRANALPGQNFRVGRWRDTAATIWWYMCSDTAGGNDATHFGLDVTIQASHPDSRDNDTYTIVLIGK